MSDNNIITCTVTTFYSPSLFWIVYEDDIVKRHKYNERFNKPLVQFDIISDASVNEKVILQHREVWYRAEVVNVRQILNRESSFQSKTEYICWLLDYGYFVSTRNVYNLPENELLIPPFARKSMLYGIRSSSLDYDFGDSQMKEKVENDWSPGIRRFAYEILKEPESTYGFSKRFNFEDFSIGDLFITSGDEPENMKDKFLDKALAIVDEDFFMSKLQILTKLDIKMAQVYLETRFFTEDLKKMLDSPERMKGHSTFRAMQTYFVEKEKKTTKVEINNDDKPESGRAKKFLKTFGDEEQNAASIGKAHKMMYSNSTKKFKGNSSKPKNKSLGNDWKNYQDVDQLLDEFIHSGEKSLEYNPSSQSGRGSNEQISIQSVGRGRYYRSNTENKDKQLPSNLTNSDLLHHASENDALIDNVRFGKVQKSDDSDNSSIASERSAKNLPCDFNSKEWFGDVNQINFIGRKLLKFPSPFKSDSNTNILKAKDKEQNTSDKIQKSVDTHEIIKQTQDLKIKEQVFHNSNYVQSDNENKYKNNIRQKFAINKTLRDNTSLNTKKDRNSQSKPKEPKIFGLHYGSKILSFCDENHSQNSGNNENSITPEQTESKIDFKSKYAGRGFRNRSESSSSGSNSTDKNDEVLPSFGRGFSANKSLHKNNEVKQGIDSSKSMNSTDSFSNDKMEANGNDVFKDVEENSSVFCNRREFQDEVQFCPAGNESLETLQRQNFPESFNLKRPPQKDTNDTACKQKAAKIAGLCDCKDCEKWRNNDNVFDPPPVVIPQPKEREIVKPPLLFKNDDEESTKFKIKTKRNFINDTEKLAAPRLLVHGSLLVDPTNDIPHTPFNEVVQQGLRDLNYTNAYSIQSYAWPSILRGHNCIIVGSPACGKTMSYVPPICQFVLSPNPFLPPGKDPIAIILCARVEIVENVNRLFGSLLRKQSGIRVAAIVQLLEKPSVNRILKNCSVLITTPRLLIKLLKDGTIKLNRLSYVVFDEAQDLFSLFASEMNYILRRMQKLLENRTDGIPIQLITLSQEWNKQIECLAKRFKNPPFICIGSHLEAALYGRADIKLQFCDSKDKIVKLIDVIKQTKKKCKTVIVCNDNDDISEVIQHFIAHGIDHETLLTESSMEEINVVKQRWSNGYNFILMCSDNIFNTGLAISDADIMIQYSLPNNWSQFTYRFSCFIDNYDSPLDINVTDTTRCHMHIFIDETNTVQFPKLYQFLQRMGSKLPENFEKLYENLITKTEMEKVESNLRLCENILRFGSCKNHLSCKYRHILSPKIDISPTLPKQGIIKCKILNVVNPMQFSIRLLEYTDREGVQHKVKDYFSVIATHLLTLREEGIPIPVSRLKVGYFCAVQESVGLCKGSFQRCVIIDIIKHSADKIKKVLVKYIDLGHVQYVNHTHIYYLPKNFLKFPAQSVPLYISNIGPLHKDITWPIRCVTSLNLIFKHAGFGGVNTYFTGRIKLQLKDALFVDDLKLMEILDEDDESLTVQRLSVCNVLSTLQCLEKRPEHLKNLYALCNKYDIPLQNYDLPVIKKTTFKEKPQVKPSWAHLENGEEFNNVYFNSAQNPHSFFIQLCKNIDRLEKLKKDIADAVNKPFYPKITTPKEGTCYLVKDSVDHIYSRVILQKIKENTGECLFVDYGDTVEVSLQELRFLPDNLITQLPFQAIECKLYGIEPSGMDDSWSSESTDILYNVAYEPNTNIWRTLHVKVMADEKPEYTGYKKYSVILVHTFEDKQIINNLILDMGYAVATTDNPIEVDFNKINIPRTDNSYSEDEILNDDENIKDETKEKDDLKNNEVYEFKELDFNDDDRWDLQINNPDEFFPEFMKIRDTEQKSDVKIEEIPTGTNNQKLGTKLKALPAPSHGCSTPNLIWQQTDTHIIIKIQIPSVDNYDIKIVRNRMLAFKGLYKETSYRLDLNLYAKVHSVIEHAAMGLYIYGKIQKEESVEWPRLVLSKTKQRNVTYNVAVIPVDDLDDNDENPLSKEMIENSKQLGDEFQRDAEEGPYRFEIGSDIDWDESDIESAPDSDD